MFDVMDRKISDRSKGYFIALNPEKIVNTMNMQSWNQIWSNAQGIYADGIGVVLAAKILEGKSVERIFPLNFIFQKLNETKGKLFLFGAKDSTAQRAGQNIKAKFPNIQIVDAVSGYNFNSDNIVNRINQTQPDVILVALGSPIQEEWISQNIAKVNHGVFLGVGGALDIWAGNTKRAPDLIQRLGLEWLYRLITQPSRLVRQLKLPVFVLAVFYEKVHRLIKFSK